MPIFEFSLLVLIVSCGPIPNLRSILADDFTPPILTAVFADAPDRVTMAFREPVTPVTGSFSLLPTIPLLDTRCIDNRVHILFRSPLQPGREYHLEGTVEDDAGNRLKFITNFYGFNPQVPRLLINELTVRGSSTRPESRRM